VASLIAGINTCRANTVVAAIAAGAKAPVRTDGTEGNAAGEEQHPAEQAGGSSRRREPNAPEICFGVAPTSRRVGLFRHGTKVSVTHFDRWPARTSRRR
jgi:hypothetical protein